MRLTRNKGLKAQIEDCGICAAGPLMCDRHQAMVREAATAPVAPPPFSSPYLPPSWGRIEGNLESARLYFRGEG